MITFIVCHCIIIISKAISKVEDFSGKYGGLWLYFRKWDCFEAKQGNSYSLIFQWLFKWTWGLCLKLLHIYWSIVPFTILFECSNYLCVRLWDVKLLQIVSAKNTTQLKKKVQLYTSLIMQNNHVHVNGWCPSASRKFHLKWHHLF